MQDKPIINHPRRDLLKKSLFAGSAFAISSASSYSRASDANRRVRMGVIGLNRGLAHINMFSGCDDVEIAYVCDVDSKRLATGAQRAVERQDRPAKTVDDFRTILDDPSVDAVSIAAPNFWHAPMSIMACAAGKDVYVEKPGSHTPQEALMLGAAAKSHKRKVQMGVQRRSMPHYAEAAQRMKEGEIGDLKYARCWYNSARGGIGRGKPKKIPSWLNYALWQKVLPDTPFKDNLIHYNWHWHWFWGNGELGNNGIHFLDIARWGMGVETPAVVNYSGARYHFDDDQETPDTGYASFDFGPCGITWEQSSCLARRPEKHSFATFYGTKASLAIDDSGFTLHDTKGKEIHRHNGNGSHKIHFQNFIDAVRGEAELNAEISEGQKSTMLCHLGNIAYRTASTLKVDQKSGTILDHDEALSYWQKEYRSGWEPKV